MSIWSVLQGWGRFVAGRTSSRRAFLTTGLAGTLVGPAGRVTGPACPQRTFSLLRCPVAGFQYHDGPAVCASLATGDRCRLLVDPENPFDSNAVRVECHGAMLGHLPRAKNALIASLLSQGAGIECQIMELRPEGPPWNAVEIEVSILSVMAIDSVVRFERARIS